MTFFFAESVAVSVTSFAASFAASVTSSVADLASSVAALTALSLVPPQPLPAAVFTSSVLPALGFVPLQPLPDACAPGMLMPPALISAATPRLARSFFMSLLFIGILL